MANELFLFSQLREYVYFFYCLQTLSMVSEHIGCVVICQSQLFMFYSVSALSKTNILKL